MDEMAGTDFTVSSRRGGGAKRSRLPVGLLLCLGSAILVLALTAACSLILDLEPDCDQVSNCTPYVCNQENTACLSRCNRYEDCATGYLCELATGSCLTQGCAPLSEPVPLLEISGSGVEYDADGFGDSFWVLYANGEGISLAEVSADGALVGGVEGVIALETDNLASPVQPLVVPSDGSLHLFWLGALGTNRLAIRHYAVSPEGVSFGPVNAYEADYGQNVDQLTGCRIGDKLALAWTTLRQRSQTQLLLLNLDGTYGDDSAATAPNEAAVFIGDPAAGSNQPALAMTDERGGYARRETRAGVSTIMASFFDSQFGVISNHQVSGDEVSSAEGIRAAGLANAMAVAWVEVREGQRVIMRAVDSELSPLRLAWNTNDYTTNPKELSLAARADEFALVWVGDSTAGRDLFFSRFSANGEQRFITFPVRRGAAVDPAYPVIVAVEDGYALFWLEGASPTRTVFFQRYSCIR
ncbi:MAG: hypothetical protein JW797_01120 [Bradymonadales bacterium]|nr:hypothetical protein [Bradymonadales bacterium]